MSRFLIPSILALSLGALPVVRAGVALDGPLVLKLDWSTHSLQSIDLNNDGLNDLVVIDGDHSAIELIYQVKGGKTVLPKNLETSRWEPVVEDAPFRKASVTTSCTVYDVVAGDLNKDGLPDLAYTGDPDNLTLRYQNADGTWTEDRVEGAPAPQQGAGSLRIADMNGDGRLDLVTIGTKELGVFLQSENGKLGTPDRYPLPDDSCYGLEIVDVDGDGRLDAVYLCNNSREPVRVRRQTAAHEFGPELAYAVKPSRCTLQVLRNKTGPTFAFAQDNTGHLEEFRLTEAKVSAASGMTLRPRIFSPRATVKSASAYALGDFNRDGRLDVAVSDPDGATAYVYLRQADGGFTLPTSFPVLSDAKSIAAIDWSGDGNSDLVVASPKEQSIGVSTWKDGRLTYPQPLTVTGKPVCLATSAAPLNGGGGTLAVAVEEGGKRRIEFWKKKGTGYESTARVDLAGLRADPRSLLWCDANQDGRLDLAVFSSYDPMRLLIQDDKGAFADISGSPVFRKSLVDNLDGSAVTAGDVDGDGKAELIVSTGSFARALRLGAGGELTVVDQFNGRDINADVSTAFAVDSKGKPLVVLYDRKADRFEVLKANKKGIFENCESVMAGKIEVVGTRVLKKPDGGSEVFVFGKDRFWWLPLDSTDYTASTVATHATDLPDVSYSDVASGDLNGDGIAELVCIDPNKNLIEILERGAEGRWESKMHFKVFEVDEHYQGRKGGPLEPRETVVADVTGDGKKDLILLVHDRILVYPQQ